MSIHWMNQKVQSGEKPEQLTIFVFKQFTYIFVMESSEGECIVYLVRSHIFPQSILI
jgi:hypothetical protein